MSISLSLRRSLGSSTRNISLAICGTATAAVDSTRQLSYLVAAAPSPSLNIPRSPSALPTNTFSNSSSAISYSFLNSCRGYAKGRKQFKEEIGEEDDDDYDEGGNLAVAANVGPTIKSAAVSQMEAAVDALSRELAKLRTGRASAGMLDHIIVETAGVKMPLSRMAAVSVLDSKTLSVTPYDPNTLKELEKAIVSSPLGLNPRTDNQRLIAAIPPLTKEHMQAVCKVVTKSSEDVKQSIRRARQKALDSIKKALPNKKDKDKKKDKGISGSSDKKKDKDKAGPSFSEDDAKRLEKEIDELTKKFIKSAEDMCKAKEKEITAG